jgi:hypothetical protein
MPAQHYGFLLGVEHAGSEDRVSVHDVPAL